MDELYNLGGPGKDHPAHPRIADELCAHCFRPRARSCNAARGIPARAATLPQRRDQGLARRVLQARCCLRRAALTSPIKIESGKFQGLMHHHQALGLVNIFKPVSHLLRVITAEVRRLAHLGNCIRKDFPASRTARPISTAHAPPAGQPRAQAATRENPELLLPTVAQCLCRRQRRLHLTRARLDHRAYPVGVIGGVDDGRLLAV